MRIRVFSSNFLTNGYWFLIYTIKIKSDFFILVLRKNNYFFNFYFVFTVAILGTFITPNVDDKQKKTHHCKYNIFIHYAPNLKEIYIC